jgi:Cu/Ag efflux protein CusF
VPRVARWRLALVFAVLLLAFGAGIWGTVVRPAAYEVRGQFVARPAVNLILITHDAVPELGMRAMELMTVFGEPAMLDAAALTPGDRVRVAVRRRNDELVLLRVEKLPR